MSFTGGDKPIDLFRSPMRGVQGIRCSFGCQVSFVLTFLRIGKGDNPRALAKLAVGHAKGAVNFFRRNSARSKDAGGTTNLDGYGRRQHASFCRNHDEAAIWDSPWVRSP